MLSSLYSTHARRDTDGFTLIELLVVVIIIGLLAAIALPIFIDQQKVAVDASVKSDVRNTVTNVVNAQAQGATTVKVAKSNSNTVEVRDADGTVLASSASSANASPALGDTYIVDGYNTGGKQYSSNASAFTFRSLTGQFSTTDISALGNDVGYGTAGYAVGRGSGTGPSVTSIPDTTAYYKLATYTDSPSYSVGKAQIYVQQAGFTGSDYSRLTGINKIVTNSTDAGLPTLNVDCAYVNYTTSAAYNAAYSSLRTTQTNPISSVKVYDKNGKKINFTQTAASLQYVVTCPAGYMGSVQNGGANAVISVSGADSTETYNTIFKNFRKVEFVYNGSVHSFAVDQNNN